MRPQTLAILIYLFHVPFIGAQSGIHRTEAQVRGADTTQVQLIETKLGASGEWITTTNSYTELATGLNYYSDATQRWEPSVEEIEPVETGAAALKSPHKIYFASTLDDPQGSIDILTENGQRFRSSVLSLCYYDPVKGVRVEIAMVRDTQGELLVPNRVIYRDAFESTDPTVVVECDVLYTFRRSGFEQDVILRRSIPPPEDYGLTPDVTRLEVLTEFYESPVPRKISRLLAAVQDEKQRAAIAEPDWEDETLDFGSFVIGDGTAFRISDRGPVLPGTPGSIIVGKRWLEQGNRRVLSESVEFAELTPLLAGLPLQPPRAAALFPASAISQASHNAVATRFSRQVQIHSSRIRTGSPGAGPAVPFRRLATLGRKAGPMLVATKPLDTRSGVVIDYAALAVNVTNFTFRADETYLVSDQINLNGTTTLEGGAVIKYARYNFTTPYPQLTILGPFQCRTSPYRPAIFTAADDQTVGQWITNSLSAPPLNAYYGTHAILFGTDPNPFLLEHVRFRHALYAVLATGRNGTIRHAQFEACRYPIYASGYWLIKAQNILARGTDSSGGVFNPLNYAMMVAENATLCNFPNLYVKDANSTLTLRNTILAGITNIAAYLGQSDPLYGNATQSGTSGLFAPVGGAGFYLAPDSTHRNAGVEGIDPVLREHLRFRTTQAPQVLSGNVTINTTLNALVERDTDAIDRGYHYDPLDYCLTSLSVSNAVLTITNGVAIGVYGGNGFTLRNGSRLVSHGAPGRLNHIVRFDTVQERATNWGNAASNAFSIFALQSTGSAVPSLELRFTELAHLAVTTNSVSARRLIQTGAGQSMRPLAITHCMVRGLTVEMLAATGESQTIGLTNTLFEASSVSFTEAVGGGASTVIAYNNLFSRGAVTFANPDATAWTIRDNLFDPATLASSGSLGASHNAFRSGVTAFGVSNVVNLTPNFISGPFGRYYYPRTPSGTNLAALINAGSRNADVAGLYHFATTADGLPEAATKVDIGLHYPTASSPPVVQGLVGSWRFNEGSGTTTADSGPYSLHGVLTNGTAWAVGAFQSAASFDGVNDSVVIPDGAVLRLPNSMSIALWVFKTSESSDYVRYVGKGASAARNYGLWDDAGVSGRVFFQCMTSPSTYPSLFSSRHVPVGLWTHLAFTWNGTSAAIYINGELDATGPLAGNPITSTDPVTVGYAGYHGLLNGGVDEVMVFNRALSPTEVISLYKGKPSDTDGDGAPDASEDGNGNGAVDSGETSWTSSESGMSGPAVLQVHTPLR
jgi:hypothetical protein